MDLAEKDGFDAVRLRDLSSRADVALGTVYRRFRSKEDILAAALELEVERLELRLREHPAPGDTAEERLVAFFKVATMGLVRRPKLSAAMLRTVASGDPELAEKVTRYHGVITGMVVDALRGRAAAEEEVRTSDLTAAFFLQQVWFGALVGWTSELISATLIHEQMHTAIRVVLAGKHVLEVP